MSGADGRDSLPTEMQPALLALVLETLSEAVSPTNATTYQPANAIVVRKLFGCVSASEDTADSSSRPSSFASRSTASPTRSPPFFKRFQTRSLERLRCHPPPQCRGTTRQILASRYKGAAT